MQNICNMDMLVVVSLLAVVWINSMCTLLESSNEGAYS